MIRVGDIVKHDGFFLLITDIDYNDPHPIAGKQIEFLNETTFEYTLRFPMSEFNDFSTWTVDHMVLINGVLQRWKQCFENL